MKESKEEFEDRYIKGFGVDREFYDRYFVTVVCDCGEDVCTGWAAEPREEE